MALENDDLIVVQKNGGGELRKAKIGDISGKWTEDSGKLYPTTLTNNVGIGTDSPATDLHVKGTTSTVEVLESTNNQCLTNIRNSATELFYVGTTDENWNVQTNATQHLSVTTVGDVGIGTQFPKEKLHVDGTLLSECVAFDVDQNGAYLIATGNGYNSGSGGWNEEGIQHRLKVDSGGVPRVTIDTPNEGEVFCVTNDGDVGIGTDSPDAKLEVEANGAGAHPAIELSNYTGNHSIIQSKRGLTLSADYPDNSGDDGSSSIFFDTDGTTKAVINGAGYVGIGETNPAAVLEIAAPVASAIPSLYLNRLTNQADTSDIALVGNSVIRGSDSIKTVVNNGGFFTWNIGGTSINAGMTGASEMMRINPNGDVGIGTDSPDAKLEVYNDGYSSLLISGNDTNETQLRFKGGTAARINNEDDSALIFGTNSTEKVRIQPNGNVGIGTDSPSVALEISGTTGSSSRLRVTRSGSSGELGVLDNDTFLAPLGSDGSNGGLRFYAGGGEKVRILSNGNCGIGRTDPAYPLDVNGHIRGSRYLLLGQDQRVQFGTSSTASIDGKDNTDGDGYLKLSTAGKTGLYIDNQQNCGIGTDSPLEKLHVSTGDNSDGKEVAIALGGTTANGRQSTIKKLTGNGVARPLQFFSSPNNTGEPFEFYPSANNLAFYIKGDGNCGIGTDAPAEKLHVAGNARIGGDARNGGENGLRLSSVGVMTATRGGTDELWVGYQNGNNQKTSSINAAGKLFATVYDIESLPALP